MKTSKGEELELTIESAAFEGTSLGRAENLVVFVPHGVPGDRVRVRIVRKRRRYIEGTILEILSPSPNRIEPLCQYFGICGGCTLQNCSYAVQLENKRNQVRDLIQRIGKISVFEMEPTIPSPDIYGYRNKMEFTFGAHRWLTQEEVESGSPVDRSFALGLHIPKRFDRILDLEMCHLQACPSPEIVNRVRQLSLAQQWTAYDTKTRSGFLRNLVIRKGILTQELMVNLITSSHSPERLKTFSEALLQEFPEITTLLNTINSGPSPVAPGDEVYVVKGDGVIHEKVGHLKLRLGPTSFFQPNSKQALNLFSTIAEFASLTPDQTVFDVYCGLGAIGLYLAHQCHKVVGIEAHPESIHFARINTELNSLSNIEFVEGDASEAFSDEFLSVHGLPDVVILDPPRAGIDRKVVQRILETLPPRIIYSSCNPATQARDLELLSTAYRLDRVRPVDMFPQTFHIESVACLVRKTN